MKASGGRKPQPLPPGAAHRLRRLHERKLRADDVCRSASDELVLAVLDAIEQDGASVREIGKALERPYNTVQSWVEKARQIRRNRLG